LKEKGERTKERRREGEKGRRDGWRERWMEGEMDGRRDGWKERWMEGEMDGGRDGWRERWMMEREMGGGRDLEREYNFPFAATGGGGYHGYKGGELGVAKPSQHVLQRSAVTLDNTHIEVRLTASLPAMGV
jgi:hypothetical protein